MRIARLRVTKLSAGFSRLTVSVFDYQWRMNASPLVVRFDEYLFFRMADGSANLVDPVGIGEGRFEIVCRAPRERVCFFVQSEHSFQVPKAGGFAGNPMGTDGTSDTGAAGPRTQHIAGVLLIALRKIVDIVAIILLCAMIGLILFQILGRYVFNYSISWSEETAIFSQVWLVMLGAGIAMRNRNHVGVDVLIARCPIWVQRIAKATSFLLGAWLMIVIITGSFSLIAIGMIVKSAALQIPLAIPYIALPVGMSYFLLEFAIATLPEIRNPVLASAPAREDVS